MTLEDCQPRTLAKPSGVHFIATGTWQTGFICAARKQVTVAVIVGAWNFIYSHVHAGISHALPRLSTSAASDLSAEAVRGDVAGCVSAMTPPPQAALDRGWSGGGAVESAPLRLLPMGTLSIKDSTSRGPRGPSCCTPPTPVSSQDHPNHCSAAGPSTSGDGSLPHTLPQLLVQNDGPLQRKVATARTFQRPHYHVWRQMR